MLESVKGNWAVRSCVDFSEMWYAIVGVYRGMWICQRVSVVAREFVRGNEVGYETLARDRRAERGGCCVIAAMMVRVGGVVSLCICP